MSYKLEKQSIVVGEAGEYELFPPLLGSYYPKQTTLALFSLLDFGRP
jgi:hypothetical protein